MKIRVSFMVALLAAFFAVEAFAIEEENIGVTLTVGDFGPTGDLASDFNNSLGAAAQIGYFVEDVLSLNLGGTFASFPAKQGTGSAQQAGFYIMPEFIQPVYDYFLPGLSLGAGFYSTNVSITGINDSGPTPVVEKRDESAVVFGLTGGLNIRFLIKEKLLLGINGRYHALFPHDVKVVRSVDAAGNIQSKDYDTASDFYHLGLEFGFAF